MSIVVKTLWQQSKDSYRHIRDIARVTVKGGCYEFAIAVHEGTGYPIVGMMVGDTIFHVAVRRPNGRYLDGRGSFPERRFGAPFNMPPPYTLREVTPQELLRERERHGETIRESKTMRRICEALWPMLPWKSSFRERATAFAEELEALSRKHKLWLVGTTPTQLPFLVEGHADELGYLLKSSETGNTFLINRLLPGWEQWE